MGTKKFSNVELITTNMIFSTLFKHILPKKLEFSN